MNTRNCIDDHDAAITTAGGVAYFFDEDYTDNPYDEGTPEHELWNEGWWAAAREDGV